MSLAKSYADEEKMNIQSFRNMLELGAEYVDELHAAGEQDSMQNWLQGYFKKLSVILGENTVDPYAVIDGKIVGANPWEGDDSYDYGSTMWYNDAIEAQGETIFTDVYQDAITGQPIVTLAKELKKKGNVLAFDLYPERFHEQQGEQDIPKECSFYMCDSSGNLIRSSTPWNMSREELQDNVNYLLSGIRDGSLTSYDSSFADYEGKQRGVYYYEMDEGWTVIITIPVESVLMGEENMVVYVLAGVSLLIFIILFIMVLRDLIQIHQIGLSESTIRILGDSFYAIYLLNLKKGTYEFIKPSEDIAQEVPLKGTYEELLKVIRKYVEKDISDEFENAFSLEKIRERVKNRVSDYGGDYRRRFGDVYKWVNVRTLYNEKIAPDKVIFCFREVDMEKRQQQQHLVILQDALETARESAKEKESFFNRMSHDMRTPLNAIIGYCELIMKNQGNWEKTADYMDKILHAGRQLLELINDILELSRIQSGKNILKNEEFDIEKCIRGSVSLFEEIVKEQHKHLKVDIKVNDAVVFGDPFKLEQIMNNLLSNAFKYSDAGAEISVTMRQRVSMKRSKYEIIVADTGIGMSEEFLEHIFDPYSRETGFTSKTIMGTGLGMPIVKSLVRQLSGEIKAESRLGEGSRFTVAIPFDVVSRKKQELPETVPKSRADSLKGRRILLAEDNELNREIATEILSMNGVDVVSAVNGGEAVRIFSASPPFHFDAVLMDMQMPVMDGCEAARRIRAMDRQDALTVPIIAVTANAFAEDIIKTSNAGMNGHISKPIDFNVLTQTLLDLIKR